MRNKVVRERRRLSLVGTKVVCSEREREVVVNVSQG